jgi:polyhydroxyalkanoate synthase
VEKNRDPERAKPAIVAALGEQQRLWKNLLSVPRVVQTAWDTRVGTSPHDVVLRKGTHALLHYHRDTPPTQAEPLLLCYALVNRPYILDLQPDKSVVVQYLRRGFDVYMIDWGVPTDADSGLTLEHYVSGFLAEAVDFARRAHDGARAHLVGYCMGGTMSALHGALEPDTLATLTLLAAPIDFAGHESLLNLWTQSQAFDVDKLIEAYGNCPAWFLQWCFLAMNPVRNFLDKAIGFYEQMTDPRSMENHFALEQWLNDNIPVAGATFREFVTKLYQRNQLVRGEMQVGPRRVDLGRLTCPVLLLTAKNDHLVAPEATEGIRPHLGGGDVTSMGISAGHVGLVVGAKAHAKFWPEATRWAAERSTVATFATPLAASSATAPSEPRAVSQPPTDGPTPSAPRKPARRPVNPEPRWWALNR